MAEPLNLAVAIGLPPARAVEYFKAKGYTVTENWHDLWQEAHARAFTVAGAMRLDVLEDIRAEVQSAIEGKLTLRDFQRNLEPRLKANGWWGPQVRVNPDTGEAQLVQTGSPWRLRTIYRTNLQTAYMAGRYGQMIDNVRFRPYWQYVAVMDARTRPAHAAMNGLVFRYDDPFWEHFYPPNGFNCRCTVRALSQLNVDQRDIAISESGKYLREAWAVDKSSGLTERVSIFKTPQMQIAGRTDLGWNYNPGRAAWQPDLDAYDFQLARQYVAGSVTGPDFARFVAAAGRTQGNFPVAVLQPADRELLQATSQTVLLSDATLAKQAAAHPEIALADYRKLQAIMDTGEVYRQGDLRLVFLQIDGAWYRAVVKVTRDGKEIYLSTLFRTRLSEVDKARAKLEKVR